MPLKADFSCFPSDYEVLWRGIIKLDPSVSRYISSAGDQDFKVVDISDSAYPRIDRGQLDNPDGLDDFPSKITIFVNGKEALEYMSCSAIMCYEPLAGRGLFKNRCGSKKTPVKGFILEPLESSSIAIHNPDACLGSIQVDSRFGSSLAIEKSGILLFASGSQTSNITFGNPSRSVTIVFLASAAKPFVAYLRSKTKTTRWSCSEIALSIEEVADNSRPPVQVGNQPDPIQILKVRLAKGEITMDEYRKLRKILDEEDKPSNNFDWI